MARIRTQYDPAQKEFDIYRDFSGGMNNEIANEQLRDNEFPELINVDLSGRGSAKKRSGRTLVLQKAGTAQGAFLYYRLSAAEPDVILAVDGQLHVKAQGSETLTYVPIKDGETSIAFQVERKVEAVQYGEYLYIATGTKLARLRYNAEAETPGFEAEVVEPYTPTVMEAIYIGTNGLAPNPDAYVQDGESTKLEVVGIQPSARAATVNQITNMVVYINKPASIAAVEYKWEYKKSSETTWTEGRTWTEGTAGKSWDFRPTQAVNYDVKVTARDKAVTTTTADYMLNDFPTNAVEDKTSGNLPTSGIQTCNRILLHWDRLVLYGDTQHPYQCYISDLENPAYYPITNSINFDTGKREAIERMIRFQSMLIVFTRTTIQTVLNKSPETYERYEINNAIGTNAPDSVCVAGNVVFFKSNEGVHALRPNPYRLDTMNVSRVDTQIKSEIASNTDACSFRYNSQYWLCFPSRKTIYRFYFEQGVWVKDESENLNIMQFFTHSEDVYNLTTDGKLLKHDSTVYSDAGALYDKIIGSKYYDLAAILNYKTLKRLYMIASNAVSADYYIEVYADAALMLSPTSGEASVDETGTVVWTTTTAPNVKFNEGTRLGRWIMGTSPFGNIGFSFQEALVRGKCRRVKIRIVHKDDSYSEILGFGFEYKYKKP